MQVSLADKAYTYLRDKLLAGCWPPGTQLVTRGLAHQIGVSAIPVREAIQRLAVEGLLTHVSGAGAFVPRPDLQDFADLYGLREALESYAAQEAAQRATARELVTLEVVCDEFRALAREIAESGQPCANDAQWLRTLELEDHFHGTVLAAAHNRWLFKVASDMRLLTRVFGRFRDHREVLTPQTSAENAEKHERLLEVLRRKDADEARRTMAEHLRGSSDLLLRVLAHKQMR